MNYTCTSIRLQEIIFYVPDNFDPKEVLSPHLRRCSDHACHVVDRIVTTPVRNRRIRDGRVPINMATERDLFPTKQSCTQVVGDMLDKKVVERDGVYFLGQKSNYYWMGEAYRNRPTRPVIATDPSLIRKIVADQQRRLLALDPTCQNLYDRLRMLRIDHRAAKAATVRKAKGQATRNLAIDMIRDGRFFASRCEFGRFHSNLTNLPSSLRCYLTAQGKRLVSVDLKNFQPLLFAFLVQRRYENRPMPPDARRYADDCLSGDLYEKLAGKKLPVKKERQKVKRMVFRVMFGKNQYGERPPWMARRFMELYPSVYAILREWKVEAQNYRVVAWELQRSESNFVIGRVAPVLMDQFPRKFVGTIHDSCLVTAGLEADVQAILKEEARKHFGVELRVEPEYLTPPTRST